MKDLINLKEKHYVVNHHGKPYAVNGIKHPIENLATEKNINIHPISKVGIINYNEILNVSSRNLTLSGHPVTTPS